MNELDNGTEIESPSIAVTEAIKNRDDVAVEDLPPLSDTVDPDALDRLLREAQGVDEEHPLQVRFRYHGYSVEVQSDGEVTLTKE